jgi:predicted ATP-dependent protease
VYEDHPTHDNLVGRVEHVSRMGALVTDFTLIKPGALHRANGGYLIVDALKLLTQPLAWEALKRALRSRQLAIESLGQAIGLVSTQSLEPEPIPLDVRVVLVGQRELYYRLHELDSEFARLFKVVADFRDHVERTGATEQAYAKLVAAIARDKGLRPLDRAGLGRVIEHAASMAESADRLSLHMSGIVALLEEADHCAERGAHPEVTGADVQQALDAQRRRADRIVVEMRDEMLSGRLLVATEGDRVGQVNGLTIAALGGFRFGLPVRITARARLGHGGVIDLEREAELGGPIHSKSMLIVAGYLAARYAPNVPLSLSATLVFEQTYGAVEGDSASLAEVCALLSALADTPLSNAIAVTGSINQHGDVQAVGAVNQKVEGFFDLCALRGLSGRQGAIVPSSNVGQLMLRPDLVEAVAAGRFAVYAVDSVDAAMQVLTGLDAGQRDAMNRFPAGSLNARIEERLVDFAERARAFAAPARKHGRLHEAG